MFEDVLEGTSAREAYISDQVVYNAERSIGVDVIWLN